MSKILRVDLTTGKSAFEELPGQYKGLGGRGLTSAIVAAEVPPKADPLGPENVVVFAPGIVAGTTLPNSGRLSVGGKSPLTGTIKESNSGGTAARKLARLGISAGPVTIRITKDGVAFRPASALWGLGNYAAVEALKAEFPGTGLITIGPAGEKMLKATAVIVTSPDFLLRTAARGGLGAVRCWGARRSRRSPWTTRTAPVKETLSPGGNVWDVPDDDLDKMFS